MEMYFSSTASTEKNWGKKFVNYLQRRNELTFQDVKFHARNECVRFGRPGVTGAIEKVKMITAAALLLSPGVLHTLPCLPS